MRMLTCQINRFGQTTLEYLLLLAVVAVVVVASFGRGSLIDKIHDTSQDYFNSVSRVIMGENPTPIPGAWCPVTCSAPHTFGPTIMYAACECPPPAFGGQYCQADSTHDKSGGVKCPNVLACNCPSGQICSSTDNQTVICKCGNGFKCDPAKNWSPDPTCTSCQCNDYTFINPSGDGCSYCQKGYTSYDHLTCVPVKCQDNSSFDPNTNQCECWEHTFVNPLNGSCNYCQKGYTSYDHKTCVPVQCQDNSTFNPDTNNCECWKDFHITANGQCVPGNGTSTETMTQKNTATDTSSNTATVSDTATAINTSTVTDTNSTSNINTNTATNTAISTLTTTSIMTSTQTSTVSVIQTATAVATDTNTAVNTDTATNTGGNTNPGGAGGGVKIQPGDLIDCTGTTRNPVCTYSYDFTVTGDCSIDNQIPITSTSPVNAKNTIGQLINACCQKTGKTIYTYDVMCDSATKNSCSFSYKCQ